MTVSAPWKITTAMFFSLCLTNADADSDQIRQITERIRSGPDLITVLNAMAELVAIDDAEAAAAFANELIRIEASLDRGNERTLVPYLDLIFGFTDREENRETLVPAFERLLELDIGRFEHLYIIAAQAKFGVPEKIQWLIDEYHVSKSDYKNLGYTASAFELLCKTNQDVAVRFVVEEALESTDPTLKLGTERCLRQVGNAASLELMRRWNSVESGDFDLLVAEYYLQSIIEFGDSSDLEFIEWLSSNAEQLFLREDFESLIMPLIATAKTQIDQRSRPEIQ